MGKPLLTDEVLAKANAKSASKVKRKLYFDQRDLDQAFDQFDPTDEEGLTERIEVEASVVKSRRIENEKRQVFQHKLNKILLIIILLVLALIFAIFKL